MLVDGYDQHLRELGLRRLLPKKGDKHYHHIAYAMQSSGFGDDEGDHDDKHVMCIITTECSVIQCSHLDLKECRPQRMQTSKNADPNVCQRQMYLRKHILASSLDLIGCLLI